MRVLVCGGAGYIGSQMCKLLAETGHQVAVIDDLSTGHAEAVRWGRLFKGDIGDDGVLAQAFSQFKPHGVMHFAAKSIVGDSASAPAIYYANNVGCSLRLFEFVRRAGIPLVFSSTAAVYGKPVTPSISENHPKAPINVYGRTKLFVESLLADYFTAYKMSSVSFRYFNAAGADPSGEIGEDHQPETHLIPKVLRSISEPGQPLWVNGTDYDTADGTCVRDYIHVRDLCAAHMLGLEYAMSNPGSHMFNLGNERGHSILDVIQTAEDVTGRKIAYQVGPRREGDPERLVADSTLARRTLGWKPQICDLRTIIETAYNWHLHAHAPEAKVARLTTAIPFPMSNLRTGTR